MRRFLKNSLGIALLLISMIGKAQNFEKTELGVKVTINSVGLIIYQNFNIAFVNKYKGTGMKMTEQYTHAENYMGKKIIISKN